MTLYSRLKRADLASEIVVNHVKGVEVSLGICFQFLHSLGKIFDFLKCFLHGLYTGHIFYSVKREKAACENVEKCGNMKLRQSLQIAPLPRLAILKGPELTTRAFHFSHTRQIIEWADVLKE